MMNKIPSVSFSLGQPSTNKTWVQFHYITTGCPPSTLPQNYLCQGNQFSLLKENPQQTFHTSDLVPLISRKPYAASVLASSVDSFCLLPRGSLPPQTLNPGAPWSIISVLPYHCADSDSQSRIPSHTLQFTPLAKE